MYKPSPPVVEYEYPEVPCAHCGRPFPQNRKDKIYCTPACKSADYHAKRHGLVREVAKVDGRKRREYPDQLRMLAEKAAKRKDLETVVAELESLLETAKRALDKEAQK